jgi:equilibrative nucleoside transporter 1/2/3
MDRIRQIFDNDTARDASYEPLEGGSERPDGQRIEEANRGVFSWADYSVFLLLGVAMLWAWYDYAALYTPAELTFP